jgi:hypothetical protein
MNGRQNIIAVPSWSINLISHSTCFQRPVSRYYPCFLIGLSRDQILNWRSANETWFFNFSQSFHAPTVSQIITPLLPPHLSNLLFTNNYQKRDTVTSWKRLYTSIRYSERVSGHTLSTFIPTETTDKFMVSVSQIKL